MTIIHPYAFAGMKRDLNIEKIEQEVCKYYQIKPRLLHKKDRRKAINLAKHITIYLARKYLPKDENTTHKSLAGYFGLSDHTTAINAVKRISDVLSYDEDFQNEVREILGNLCIYR